MTEADKMQEQLYLNQKYQLYNTDKELIGGFPSLRALKEDMFKLYCDYDDDNMREEIEVWDAIKSMSCKAYGVWLMDALGYSCEIKY